MPGGIFWSIRDALYTRVKAFIADVLLLARDISPNRTLGTITTLGLNHFLRWLQAGRDSLSPARIPGAPYYFAESVLRWLRQGGVLAARTPRESAAGNRRSAPCRKYSASDELKPSWLPPRNPRQPKPDARPYTLLAAAFFLATRDQKG